MFVTAGDPSLDELPSILQALEEGGADIIEVGIPFSDPIADGPTIQASSQRALDKGTTPATALEALRRAELQIPVVLMGYYNPVLKMGIEEFASRSLEVGAHGMIMCDVIPEEASEWIAACRRIGMDTVFLAAPTSTDQRLDEICSASTGFVYAVSRTGVTGASQQSSGSAEELVDRLRTRTDKPICVGFGISTPDHVASVCQYADGAVVGSWLVDYLQANWNRGEGSEELVKQVRRLKEATRSRP